MKNVLSALIMISSFLSGCAGTSTVAADRTAASCSKICVQKLGSIRFSMEAAASENQNLDRLTATFTIPRQLLPGLELESMSKEELLKATGTSWNQDAYGVPDEDVISFVTDEYLILKFLYRSLSLTSYLTQNHLGTMTPDAYVEWFLTTVGKETSVTCS